MIVGHSFIHVKPSSTAATLLHKFEIIIIIGMNADESAIKILAQTTLKEKYLL